MEASVRNIFRSLASKIKQKINLIFIYYAYQKEYRVFKTTHRERFLIEDKDKYPCLTDKTTETSFDKHYVYHTAWAARKLKITMPEEHIDISSLMYFSTLVSAFIPVKFYDYRPAKKIGRAHV